MSSGDEKKVESRGGKTSSEIQTIHEMITEALMGTGTNNLPLDSVYTNTNFKNDHDQSRHVMYMNNETTPLTLGKLYSQFKDLDLRLTRVEEVIYKRDDFIGKKRAPTLARSEFSDDPCFGADQGEIPSRLSEFSTINPILTNSNDILSMPSYPTSLLSSYSATPLPKSVKIQKKDDIKVIGSILFINHLY